MLASLLQVWAWSVLTLFPKMYPEFFQVLRGFFDYLNEGSYPLMIADIALCSTAFLVYVPLCYFVSRAFGWTTFGAESLSLFCLVLNQFHCRSSGRRRWYQTTGSLLVFCIRHSTEVCDSAIGILVCALSKYSYRNVGSFPPLHLLTSSFNQVSVSDHALDLVYVQHVFVFCVVAGDFMTAVLFWMTS